jgi:hypothetical protein
LFQDVSLVAEYILLKDLTQELLHGIDAGYGYLCCKNELHIISINTVEGGIPHASMRISGVSVSGTKAPHCIQITRWAEYFYKLQIFMQHAPHRKRWSAQEQIS